MGLPAPEPKARGRPSQIRDLEGRDPEQVKREESLQALKRRLAPGRLVRRIEGAAVKGPRALEGLMRVPRDQLLPIPFLAVGLALLYYSRPSFALYSLLAGFGYALMTLLLVALPRVRARIARIGSGARWGVKLVVWILCSAFGFFSTAVVAMVLIIGGFTTARILRSLLLRLMAWLSPSPKGGIVQARVDPRPMLAVAVAVAAVSLTLGLYVPSLRLEGEVAFVLGALNVGLVAGLVRTDWHLLRELRRPGGERWRLRWSRGLARDVVLASTVAALMGHEVHIAIGGSAGGLPPSSTILLLLSYILICARQMPRWSAVLGKPRPELLLALGLLLVHAPLLVLLASPTAAFPYVYGIAETVGLALGLTTAFVDLGKNRKLPAPLRKLLNS